MHHNHWHREGIRTGDAEVVVEWPKEPGAGDPRAVRIGVKHFDVVDEEAGEFHADAELWTTLISPWSVDGLLRIVGKARAAVWCDDQVVTPGHPVKAGAGYDCGCGQCRHLRGDATDDGEYPGGYAVPPVFAAGRAAVAAAAGDQVDRDPMSTHQDHCPRAHRCSCTLPTVVTAAAGDQVIELDDDRADADELDAGAAVITVDVTIPSPAPNALEFARRVGAAAYRWPRV